MSVVRNVRRMWRIFSYVLEYRDPFEREFVTRVVRSVASRVPERFNRKDDLNRSMEIINEEITLNFKAAKYRMNSIQRLKTEGSAAAMTEKFKLSCIATDMANKSVKRIREDKPERYRK